MRSALPHASIRVWMAFVLTCLVVSAPAFAVRPTVVKTTPKTGATGVDPSLRQIVIEFDQDMDMRSGYSICGGGDPYPKSIGRPRWQGKRTLVWTVQLKPNHDYRFSINCPSSRQRTRSASGEAVAPYRVTFRTGGGDAAQKDTSQVDLNAQAVDILKEMIDSRYAYRDRLGLDWDKLFSDHEKMLLEAKTPQRFAQIAGVMLAHANDKHIWLETEGGRIGTYQDSVAINANAYLLPRLVPGLRKQSDVVHFGLFEDGIGYARIDSWSTRDPRAYEALYRFIGEHPDAPGIIIDVRFNSGGSETLASDLAGCFIDEPVVYAKHVYRDPGWDTGFSAVRERTLRPNTGRPKYTGRIAVLSGPVVMSSCEAFVLMMKQVPSATVFGQATRGSSGNPKAYDLGNDVTVFLPSWKAMRPDGTVFEGEGITPDITIDTHPDDFSEHDPVLDAALKHLRQ